MKEHKAALWLLVSSCVYLIIGMTLGIIVSMKLIWPNAYAIQTQRDWPSYTISPNLSDGCA